ncbi:MULTISPECIES: tudor domain-containing protein [unclassified Mesorhizobium]|uniref:tudor domain-containing protein n=1 Tax=unclassified Mesorhizobium TaxID=325217 RepID=UPI0008ECB6F4|nr:MULTISPECIES: tudor domain-containing protein [unclassified Mesorhizobium]SFT96502.1 Agenet domain-containing protein [Mesorhizobium sp. YR577]
MGDQILIKYSSLLIAAGMMALGGGAASAQTAGDWVLGNYKNAGYWFPGIAEKVEGGTVTIRYDDGDRETVSLDKVRPYDWMIGMKVQCNYKNAGEWYPGTIASLAGEKIGINYDDGDKETTKTGRCRTQ